MEPTFEVGQEGESVNGIFSVGRVTFNNADSGYAVVFLVPADKPSAPGFVAVGLLGEPRVGDCYHIEGVWRNDAKHGLQVQIHSAFPEIPRSVKAIERYLAGSNIKGMGPFCARAVVQHFGEETFNVLQQGGERLEEVPGIGPVRARMIRESWAEHQGIHELMVNLQGVAGLSPHQALRIYRQYGRESWLVVSRNPYLLAEEVRGFGFKTCDRIARALGIEHHAPPRLQAGIIHLLRQALEEGHLWCSVEALVPQACELLGMTPDAVTPQIETLILQGRVFCEMCNQGDEQIRALYLPSVAHTEQRIAERLGYLLNSPASSELNLTPEQAEQLLARYGHPSLTAEQRSAILHLLTGARLTILTGGPGTGKTTTMRSLIACLKALRVSYALCATTGRASKQLEFSTGERAATVHRHLHIGLRPQEVEPVQETVLVIDESSMIDLWLFDQIVGRLTEQTHLLLVGDVDQLPSVGPGAILQDLIAAAESGTWPALRLTRLTQIFRQEAGEASAIVVNCHRVRRGERPLNDSSKAGDYFEMFRETPEGACELAVSLVSRRLPQFLNVPPSEVQVLAPMHGGAAGIRALNDALQRALNPPAPNKVELKFTGVGRSAEYSRLLREGDKVRQTRNNYAKQVLNGDLGVITRIDLEDKLLTVRFDEHTVEYGFEELDELVHAWAMTVHSAQGSQWPAVVIVMLKNHFVMLERNILYTALSRAERLAVLVTQEQAVRLAVSRDHSTRRRTSLVRRLLAVQKRTLEELRPKPYTASLFE